MNWLAANFYALAALWAAAAAIAVWFYLHTRRPQRRRVSTLRFWNSVQPVSQSRRRRIREPWALLAQLSFLLLVIAALANPQWGVTSKGRNVVIVIDNSIWSQVRPAGRSPWINDVHQEARRILDILPPGDPVLLMSAVADSPPIVLFPTTDRAELQRGILESRASSEIADVPPRALRRQPGRPWRIGFLGSNRGLLVYVGPGMLEVPAGTGVRQVSKTDGSEEWAGGAASIPGALSWRRRADRESGNHPYRSAPRRHEARRLASTHAGKELQRYRSAGATLKLSVNGQPFMTQSPIVRRRMN